MSPARPVSRLAPPLAGGAALLALAALVWFALRSPSGGVPPAPVPSVPVRRAVPQPDPPAATPLPPAPPSPAALPDAAPSGNVEVLLTASGDDGLPLPPAGAFRLAWLDGGGRVVATHAVVPNAAVTLPLPGDARAWAVAATHPAAVVASCWGELPAPLPGAPTGATAGTDPTTSASPPASVRVAFHDLDATSTRPNPFGEPAGVAALPQCVLPLAGVAPGAGGAPGVLRLDLEAFRYASLELRFVTPAGEPIPLASAEDAAVVFRYSSPPESPRRPQGQGAAGPPVGAHPSFATIDPARAWPRLHDGALRFDALPAAFWHVGAELLDPSLGEVRDPLHLYLEPGTTQTAGLVVHPATGMPLRVLVRERESPRGPLRDVAGAVVTVHELGDRTGVVVPDAAGGPVVVKGEATLGRRSDGVHRPEPAVLGAAGRGSRLRGDLVHRATTGPDGVAEFDFLPARARLLVVAEGPSGAWDWEAWTHASPETPRRGGVTTVTAEGEVHRTPMSGADLVYITLEPGPCEVVVEVECPACQEPPDTTVWVVPQKASSGQRPPPEGRLLFPVRDGRAVFQLRPDYYLFLLPDDAPWRQTEFQHALVSGAGPHRVVLRAEPAARLRLLVRRGDGTPWPGIHLTAELLADRAVPAPPVLTTDAEGRAEFLLVAGVHGVTAFSSPDDPPVMSSLSSIWDLGEFTLGLGEVAEREVTLAVAPLRVRVVASPGGEPVVRASVHLTPIVPPPAESGTATAAARSGARRRRSLGFAERIGGTARDGTVAWTDVVPGEYNLQVEKEGFRATRQPLVLGTEGAQLEIALEPGGGRLVVVPVLPAEVAADAVLRTAGRAWREGEDMVHPLHPGRQGQGSPAATVQAGGLPPGRYSVSLQVIGRGTGAPLAAFGRDIEVREGETTEARLEVAGRGMLQIQGMNLALHDAAEAARAAGASPEEVRAAIERAAEASPALPEGATARIEPLPGPETSSPALTTGPVVGKFRRTRDAGLFLEPVRLFAGRFRVVIEAAGLVVEPEEFEVVIVPNESLHRHFDLRVVE